MAGLPVVHDARAWVPGRNVPAIHRGTSGDMPEVVQQILGNILVSCEMHLDGLAKALTASPSAASVAAHLTKINIRTVRAFEKRPKKEHWKLKSGRGMTAPAEPRAPAEPAAAPAEPAAAPAEPAVAPAGTEATATGLPQVREGSLSEDEFSEAGGSQIAHKAQLPGLTTLDRWRAHENYVVGMCRAELATFWITQSMPQKTVNSFMAWARAKFGDKVGTLNMSWRFLWEFTQSLSATLDFCTTAGLHTCLPALGLPSDITRVVDGISARSGESLWAVIHLRTDASGALAWDLLDLPNTGCLPSNARMALNLPEFKSHGPQRLVTLTHAVEKRFRFNDRDRATRLASNVGDGAIEGPNSAHFSKIEAELMGHAYDPLLSMSCEFHAEDLAGSSTDAAFPLAVLFDEFLRKLHRNFGFGAGLSRWIIADSARTQCHVYASCYLNLVHFHYVRGGMPSIPHCFSCLLQSH